MESEQPNKGGEAKRRWKQEPDRSLFAEPEVQQRAVRTKRVAVWIRWECRDSTRSIQDNGIQIMQNKDPFLRDKVGDIFG
jgi:hypothetical protein